MRIAVVGMLLTVVLAGCITKDAARTRTSASRSAFSTHLPDPSDPLPAEALRLAARDFEEIYNFWHRTTEPSIEKVQEQTCYEGALTMPDLDGRLYVFYYCGMSPRRYTVIYHTGDSVGTLYKASNPERGAMSPEIIDRITGMLKTPITDPERALDAVYFIAWVQGMLSAPVDIVGNWRDITHNDYYPVPQEIRHRIHPPLVQNDENAISVKCFVWRKTRTDLTRMEIAFDQDGDVHYSLEELGRVGVPSVIL